jgi:O-antigen/teichoic acid export membrane protein
LRGDKEHLAIAASKPGNPISLRKLAVGSSARVLHLSLLTVIGFVISPYMIHKLGAVQYGLWALANAFVGYYSLLDLGLSGAVFTHMSLALGAGDNEEGSRIYSTGLSAFSALGAILVVVTVLICAGILLFHPDHAIVLAIVVLVVGIQSAIAFPMRAPFGVLNAGGHFEMTSFVLILSAVLRAAGTVLVLRAGKGVVELAVVNLLSWIPGYIWVCFAVHWQYKFISPKSLWKWHKPTANKLIRFGVPVLVGQIADRIRLQSDAIVVSFFYGLRYVTHYNIATTLVMYYMDGITAIIGVLTPVLSMQMGSRDVEGMKRSLFMGTRIAVCAGGFCAFGLICWGKAFIVRWVGAEYNDAYLLLVVLTVAMFFDIWQYTAVNALYATMHQKTYARINISEAVANLILSLAMAKPLGMLGIALGTLIPSVIIRGLIQPWIIQKKLDISARHFYAVSLRSLAMTAVCLVAPFVISRYTLRPNYPSLFLTGGLSLVAFVLPVWKLEFNLAGADRLKRLFGAVA